MKVIAFNGSPKEKGNTFTIINEVKKQLEKSDIEVEIVHVGNKPIRGCIACSTCVKTRNEQCIIKNDEVNEYIQKAKNADGIILGSPVYFSGVNGTMKSFLDRLFFVSSANGGLLRHKVGASVVAVRRSGGLTTFNELNHYILYSEMLIAGSNYWNVVHGRAPGEADSDEEGMQIMQVLGENMSWLMKSIEASKDKVEKPKSHKKVLMNFIR